MVGWIGCGWFGDAAEEAPAVAAESGEDCIDTPDGAEVVATYETSVNGARPIAWVYWRTPTQVGRYYPARGEAEVWTNNNGDVSMERWYESDRRVVLQLPQDIAALGIRMDWEEAGALVDPKFKKAFPPTDAPPYRCQQAVYHEGQVRDMQHRLTWLPELGLVGRYAMKTAATTRVTFLKEVGPSEALTELRATRGDFEVLRMSEVMALGNDPFVQKVLRPATAVASEK